MAVKVIVDTDILSEYLKGHNANVVARAAAIVGDKARRAPDDCQPLPRGEADGASRRVRGHFRLRLGRATTGRICNCLL